MNSHSTSTTPTTLTTLLTLYLNAHARDVYIEYFAGFKLLYQWLAPIKFPTNIDSIPEEFYKLRGSYEHSRLGEILHVHPAVVLACEHHIIFQERSLWTPDYKIFPTPQSSHFTNAQESLS